MDTVAFTGVPSKIFKLVERFKNLFTKTQNHADEFSYDNIQKLFENKCVKVLSSKDSDGKTMKVFWWKNPITTSKFSLNEEIMKGNSNNCFSQFEFNSKGNPIEFFHISNSENKLFRFDEDTGKLSKSVFVKNNPGNTVMGSEITSNVYKNGAIKWSERNILYRNGMVKKTTTNTNNKDHVLTEVFDNREGRMTLRRTLEVNPTMIVKSAAKKFYPDGETLKSVKTVYRNDHASVKHYPPKA